MRRWTCITNAASLKVGSRVDLVATDGRTGAVRPDVGDDLTVERMGFGGKKAEIIERHQDGLIFEIDGERFFASPKRDGDPQISPSVDGGTVWFIRP